MTKTHPQRSEDASQADQIMRLQRFLARAGVASRRHSEELISDGRVSVNGHVVCELGTKINIASDVIAVDGTIYTWRTDPSYLALNKPAGYITTMHDPKGRPTVAELVPIDEHPGLFPVGRLDADTTGLLLFTTDGSFAERLLHPSHHVWKSYEALVDGIPYDAELQQLKRGVCLDDGPCQPCRCRILKRYARAHRALVEISLHEGRKRQVKRMLSHIGHPVIALTRVRIGTLKLGKLPEGEWRSLSPAEITALRSSAEEPIFPCERGEG